MQLHDLTVAQAGRMLRRREISSKELTQAAFARLEQTEEKVRAYLTVTKELAYAQAEKADLELASGQGGPLAGIPAGIKDVFCVEGVRTTCASRMLENFVPPYESHVVSKLRQAGMVIMGKQNLDEFAMGSSTEHSSFYHTHNPWNLDMIPGGSSGGSAASVAAGSSFYSLGTDTGGSIRQPAAHCGVVGFKPTYGLVSRRGIVPMASSLDQAGPLTRTVEDAALVLQVMAGHDPLDSTCAPHAVPDYGAALHKGVKGLKLGLPKEFFASGLDAEVGAAVMAAAKELEGQGATLTEVSLPHTDYGLAAYYIIASAESSSNLARFDAVRYGLSVRPPDGGPEAMYVETRTQGFGPEVKRRIMMGTFVLSSGYYDAYYNQAAKVRTVLIQDFAKAFAQVDAIVGPVTPSPAFAIGLKSDNPLQMYLSDVFTLACNLAGLPGMSVPCGLTSGGLPIGLQIMGPHFSEELLLGIGHAWQQASDWHTKRPAL